MSRLPAVFAAIGLLLFARDVAAAEIEVRDPDNLREIFSGTLLAGVGPEGRAFKAYLFNDGQVMLEASGHPADAGRWSIQDERFCVELRTSFQGKLTCFGVTFGGADKIGLVMNENITLETRAIGRAISLSLR
jgi:hypothetical protein